MSLTRSLAHNTIIQIIGKAVSTLLGLVAVGIMTRTLGLEQFGWYVTATGFLQFIGIISDFGFTVTTSNLLAEPHFNREKLLGTIFTWRFITAFVFQGLAPLIILWFPYSHEIKLAVAIVTISFFANALSQVFIGYYREQLKMGLVMIAEILGRILLVAGVLLAAITHTGFLAMMCAITIASLAGTVYLWIKIGAIPFFIDGAISRVLFSKMWPTALAIIFNAFYLQGDRVLLPLFVNQSAVALYGASYRILDLITQITAMLMGTIMPLVTFAWARSLTDEFKRRAQLGFDLIVLLLFPMAAGLIVLATPVLRFIAGDKFSSGGPLLQWLSLTIVGVCFGMIFGHYALAINKQRQAVWVYISDAVLSVVGYLICIPRWGVWGAAGVSIFSEWYAGILLALIVMRCAGFYPRLKTLGKILLASSTMAAVVYMVQPLNLFISILLGMVIYALAIFLLRTISRSTLKEVVLVGAIAQKPQT